MNVIELTAEFKNWLFTLKDANAKARISQRIKRAENGNFGDCKLLTGTGGVYEMRIDTGKGYRVYYAQQGDVIYILLNGGDKTTQQKDIDRASEIWREMKG